MPLYVFDIQNHHFNYLNGSFPKILIYFKIKDQEHLLNMYFDTKLSMNLLFSLPRLDNN